MSGPKSQDLGIYQAEYRTAEQAEENARNSDLTQEELLVQYRTLAGKYRQLVGQVAKITSLGDSAQGKLMRTQDELRDALGKLNRAQTVIRKELSIARAIQRQLLPLVPPQVDGVRLYSEYVALDAIGGDFIDYSVGRDGSIGILIGDATGHGVPAALLASMAKMAMDSLREFILRPHDLLKQLNSALLGKTHDHFVTVCYGVYVPGTSMLRLAIAAHPPPILLRPGEAPRQIAGKGQMLGLFPEPRIGEYEIPLQSGDSVLFLTDGVLECRSETDDVEIEEDNLLKMIDEARSAGPGNMLGQLLESLRTFVGVRGFNDDVTVVLLSLP